MIDFRVKGDPLVEIGFQTEIKFRYSSEFSSKILLLYYFFIIVVSVIGCVISIRDSDIRLLLFYIYGIGFGVYSLFHHVRSFEVSEDSLRITYWLRNKSKLVQWMEIQNIKIYKNQGGICNLEIGNKKYWFLLKNIKESPMLIKTIVERSGLIFKMKNFYKIIYQKQGVSW